MAAQITDSDGAPPSLLQLFLRGWEARRKIDACELASGSPEFSKCVSDGIAVLERATEMASHMTLFSDNEDLEEVATSSLKYLLLPELLGELTLEQREGERMDIVERARVYFVDYLRWCWLYGITKYDPPPLPPLDPSPQSEPAGREPRKSYDQLKTEREVKIQRLREKKELERRTEALTSSLNAGRVGGEEGEGEEEGGREEWVAMLKLGVYKSRDLVNSIDEEIPILRHMEAMKKGEVPVAKKPEGACGRGPAHMSAKEPMKPLVITREMLRGEVFGAGYPSLPTMSVEEFYQQRYGGSEGVEGGGGGEGGGEGVKEEEGEEKEEEGEEEEGGNEAALKKAREWDEYKDDHRRGWGNKKNTG